MILDNIIFYLLTVESVDSPYNANISSIFYIVILKYISVIKWMWISNNISFTIPKKDYMKFKLNATKFLYSKI